MVAILNLTNKSNNHQVEINEIILLDLVKNIKHRNKKLYSIWVNKLEHLYGRKFTEELLNY